MTIGGIVVETAVVAGFFVVFVVTRVVVLAVDFDVVEVVDFKKVVAGCLVVVLLVVCDYILHNYVTQHETIFSLNSSHHSNEYSYLDDRATNDNDNDDANKFQHLGVY